jgi:lipoyl(octanoyl) transferase
MTMSTGAAPDDDVEWLVSQAPVPYPEAVAAMERRVAAIRDGAARERIWLLEHPPLYTAGTSARADELLQPDRFPVYQTGRGGRFTYHGPGQRVVYPMLDLRHHGADVRAYVTALENWVILALARFGVAGERRDGRVGIWVRRPDGSDAKIAAIGVRIRRWVTYHGVAINVAPNLSHFSGIVPCGLAEVAVTSLRDLDRPATLEDLDAALLQTLGTAFPGVRPRPVASAA